MNKYHFENIPDEMFDKSDYFISGMMTWTSNGNVGKYSISKYNGEECDIKPLHIIKTNIMLGIWPNREDIPNFRSIVDLEVPKTRDLFINKYKLPDIKEFSQYCCLIYPSEDFHLTLKLFQDPDTDFINGLLYMSFLDIDSHKIIYLY